jgi:hypothetical protein
MQFDGKDVKVSERTKSMQAQFTRSLMALALNTVLFDILPILLISIALIFRINNSYIGIGIVSPFNFMPAINACLTLYLIKAYRHYVLQLIIPDKYKSNDKVTPFPASSVAF